MKRIRNIAFVIIAVAGMATAKGALPPLPTNPDANVKGYVHDGTKGIPGVLVSDGYDIVETAQDGSYYLKTSLYANEVWVVLPSGYEFGESTFGIPKRFAAIDRNNPDFQADFKLNPIGDDTNFTFLAHADTQPEPEIASGCWTGMEKGYTDMKQVADAVTKADGFKPFNLHMGDVVYNLGMNVNYDQYKQILQRTGYNYDILPTPGNHDRPYKADYEKATATYRETWGPTWYSFNRGNVHFISMDNVKIVEDGAYTRGFPEAAKQWLYKDLSYVPKNTPVVFYTHQPMLKYNTKNTAYKEVLTLLMPYKTLILSGHLHRTFNNFESVSPRIREKNLTSLAGYEWRGPCSTDGTPQGFWIFYVKGEEISWKFKWTGKDPDTNLFRLYTPGQFGTTNYKAEDEKTILVNVWDYDDDWKVTWTANGVDMGDLPHYDEAKDPWASYNYENNPNRPDYEGNPTTYHIFHADVPNNVSEIVVTATDPFGRSVSQTLKLKSGIVSAMAEVSGVQTTEVYNIAGIKMLDVEGDPRVDSLPLAPGCYVLSKHFTDGRVESVKVMK